MPEFMIGAVVFKTKGEAQKMIKSFVHNPINWSMFFSEGHNHYDLLMNLLKMHPSAKNKIGPGIDYFFIKPNKITPNFGEVNFCRIDGSLDHFSYRQCFLKRKQSSYFNEAMRSAVRDHIYYFSRFNKNHKCHVCNDESDEVDHFDPEFSEIRDSFILENPIILDFELSKDQETNLTVFKDENNPLVMAWRNYHHKYYDTLLMICSSCNKLKKESKIELKNKTVNNQSSCV